MDDSVDPAAVKSARRHRRFGDRVKGEWVTRHDKNAHDYYLGIGVNRFKGSLIIIKVLLSPTS